MARKVKARQTWTLTTRIALRICLDHSHPHRWSERKIIRLHELRGSMRKLKNLLSRSFINWSMAGDTMNCIEIMRSEGVKRQHLLNLPKVFFNQTLSATYAKSKSELFVIKLIKLREIHVVAEQQMWKFYSAMQR